MKILLVEDEPRVARFLAKGLRENAYAVDVARDGEEAVYYAGEGEYDAVILDVMLPVLSGVEVCRRVREHSAVPVLMLTALDADADRVVGLEAGADDYLARGRAATSGSSKTAARPPMVNSPT